MKSLKVAFREILVAGAALIQNVLTESILADPLYLVGGVAVITGWKFLVSLCNRFAVHAR